MIDYHVDRPGVEVSRGMKLTGTNCSIGLINLKPMRGDEYVAAKTFCRRLTPEKQNRTLDGLCCCFDRLG